MASSGEEIGSSFGLALLSLSLALDALLGRVKIGGVTLVPVLGTEAVAGQQWLTGNCWYCRQKIWTVKYHLSRPAPHFFPRSCQAQMVLELKAV